ncbi:S1C family serine protease [Opitutus sp. ER46]|uniref:S1C family serine protease n=1 Tax=Opitutus sp. ER46 TaxID=2161864 RepID=UPI000D3271A2|nr:S1C family serine protease [Opitutus sp. ER46]PTX97796.1 serine protease [Opitutus sp. ER46]
MRLPPCIPSFLRRAPLFALAVGLVAATSTFAADEAATPPAPDPTAGPVTANPAPTDPKVDAIENAVVKIFATMRRPDLYRPWSKSPPSEVTGSGVIIEGKRILTNAHVVLYASQVQVQGNQAGDKISATIETIAPGIDLAVLKLEDESFFDTRPPIARANTLPDIKVPVMAYGYPAGGTSLSITKGIVSRIEWAGYHPPVSGLRIQIDAAINRGNSGGPAISGDKMIGLAFSNLSGAQNIGYIIPNEEINLFLADVADGKYDGKPAMYDELQDMENPALAGYLKLGKEVEGIMVHEPYLADPGYPLKKWDVITRIGDTPVDNQGMVKIGSNLRVRFQYLVQKYAKDGKVPLTVVRAGKPVEIQLPVFNDRPSLMENLDGAYPDYFVYGPFVFSTLTADFANSMGGSNAVTVMRAFSAMASPILTRRGDQPAFPGEALVVVASPFFPHKLAKGYNTPIGRVIDTVNGKHVKNLPHLVELLRDAQEDYITIEFAGRMSEAIVLPRNDCIAATEEILSDNGVRAQGSANALSVWNAKAAPAK